jgi:hypothetical protein
MNTYEKNILTEAGNELPFVIEWILATKSMKKIILVDSAWLFEESNRPWVSWKDQDKMEERTLKD